jgi:hypothetical protein
MGTAMTYAALRGKTLKRLSIILFLFLLPGCSSTMSQPERLDGMPAAVIDPETGELSQGGVI